MIYKFVVDDIDNIDNIDDIGDVYRYNISFFAILIKCI